MPSYVIRAFGGTLVLNNAAPPLGTLATSVSGVSHMAVSTLFRVNGTILDTQPLVITTPTAMGSLLEAGSVFLLIFNSPSTNTQNLLANGSTVTLQFVSANGQPATAQVSIASVLIGGTSFQVTCTLLQNFSLLTGTTV